MYRVYQVQVNDTLETIADKINTSVENLKKINGIKNDVLLMPGSFLIIPMTDDRFKTYIVKKGDNIYNIAKENNVSEDLMLKINGLNKDDFIYPGQEIIIPSNNYQYYITKEGDTISSVVNDLMIDYNTLMKNNDEIFLEEDQLIIYKTN